MSKKLYLTKNVLMRAGISDYSSILSSLSHTYRNITKNSDNIYPVSYNQSEAEILQKLYSAFNFISTRERLEYNFVFKEIINEYEDILKTNRGEGVKTLTVITGGIGSGKTTLMNGLLDRVGLNSDALYVSDIIDYAKQILNINNDYSDMYSFVDFTPSTNNFKHKNIYIDSLYLETFQTIQPVFSFIEDITDNMVITLNVNKVDNNEVKTFIQTLLRKNNLNFDLHIFNIDKVCNKLSRFIDEQSNHKELVDRLRKDFKCDFTWESSEDSFIINCQSNMDRNKFYCLIPRIKDVCSIYLENTLMEKLAIRLAYSHD